MRDKPSLINTEEKAAEDEKENMLPIIEVDKDKLNTRTKDEFFVFQPPQKYGQFNTDYGQEHLQFLSKEYILPPVIIKDPKQKTYAVHSGTYNSYNSQMFTISFCCHSKSDIRLHWYVNGWNMRIPKTENFVKIWPEFFEESQRIDDILTKIQNDIIQKWKLPIMNKEYEAYSKDLLRFEKGTKKNGSNDQSASPRNGGKYF